MTYSIKTVSQKTGLSIYTLRFYDKQGLLPFVSRDASGYRAFTDGDLQLLHTICCLKDTGMKIRDIREYVACVMKGPRSIPQRKHLLQAHRHAILAQQAALQRNLQEIDMKLIIYESPVAAKIVGQELTAIQAEKTANHLPNPFQEVND
ncbi:MerR family transcriptional regulator [Levilactobacillus sp. HBUAS70063]|uniref:MerR family transcriptional regulator n=1 Tax=Levilactobacillus sp. HBUAS70063 TaxID=3109359 RepID=UPI00313351EE